MENNNKRAPMMPKLNLQIIEEHPKKNSHSSKEMKLENGLK